MVDLTIDLAGIRLNNPTILASGILGLDVLTLKRVVKNGAGAVTIKSLTIKPRKGHNSPIIIEAGQGVFMNAVGYANKGIEEGVKEFRKWNQDVPLIGSIVGETVDEFIELTERIQTTPIKILEIVLSCPHTPGYGLMAGQGSPKMTEKITKAVKKRVSLPLSVKLSPSIQGLGEVAKAAEAAGADIINMGNTVGPGMRIDINRGRPILGFKIGGLSGPAIKPLTIRAVYDIYKSVKIPIVATGGILTGKDLIEAFMVGATAVGIGTGIYYRGINIFKKITKEVREWLKKNNYKDIKNLIGLVHRDE